MSVHPGLEKPTTSHVRETRGLPEAERKEVLLEAAEQNLGAKKVRSRASTAKTKKAAASLENEKSSLTEKDRKRGEKLALHLQTLRQTREKLEGKLKNLKEEEKKAIKELKTLGEPGLFGVDL